MQTDEKICCVADYEVAAKRLMDKRLFAYLRGAANDGITYNENEIGYKRYKFHPKVMRNVSHLNTRTSILGHEVALPIGVSPFSFTGMIHPSADIGIATGCKDMETCFIQSNGSYHSMEEVVTSVPSGLKWLQFYFFKERKITANLIQRAEKLGYKAVVFTVDAVVVGRRVDDLRNKYCPTQKRLGNYEYLKVPETIDGTAKGSDAVSLLTKQFDETMTWKDVTWIKHQTNLPVVVKGIMTDFDAEEAIKHGADAIIVSNHGGRQLDGLPATIDVLEEVIKVVNGRCEVYLDGGIRSGTDVLKALALGARAVFIGRPAAWALAVNGSDGISNVLKILKEELEIAMALCGVTSVTSVDRSIVRHHGYISSL